MRRILTVLALLGAVLLSACLPVTSKVPAGTTVGFKVDPDLLGTWRAQNADKKENENGPAYLHFLRGDDGTMTALLVFPMEKDGSGQWGAYTVRAAQLGANHVLNAIEISTNGKPSDSPMSQASILILTRNDAHGHVLLYLMDERAAAAAIKSGEIAGDVEQGSSGDVHITADAAALDKFMATPKAAALFKEPLLTLTRLPPLSRMP
jgi:hypothetical protein